MTEANKRGAASRPEVMESLLAGLPMGRLADQKKSGPFVVYLARRCFALTDPSGVRHRWWIQPKPRRVQPRSGIRMWLRYLLRGASTVELEPAVFVATREYIGKCFFKKAAVGFVLVTAVSGQAMASANLVSSTPESNAVVAAGPQQIDLKFSEGIELKLSKITVIGPKGRVTTTVGLDQNDKSFVFVSFWNPLAPGKYTVDWHVVSSDRHKTQGTFTFSVKSS